MRFERLSIPAFGPFTDVAFDFPATGADLHLVYGANEAGKTTSLAAVSDLLFGFPGRSPYNVLFDYSLLRVGAVLEDAGLVRTRREGRYKFHDLDTAPLRALTDRWRIDPEEDPCGSP